MGVLKFLLPSNDLARRLAGFRKAYITGLDRTPGRLSVEFRNGLMSCFRETSESGRLFVPWPIDGYGTPIVGTATLAERPVAVHAGPRAGAGQAQRRPQPDGRLGPDGPACSAGAGAVDGRGAQRRSSRPRRPATAPRAAWPPSQASLEASSRAGDLLTEAYLSQILQNRLAATGKLTHPSGLHAHAANPTRCRARSSGPRRSMPARSASRGSRSCPRRGSTAGTCSMPSSPGAAATGWRSRPAR